MPDIDYDINENDFIIVDGDISILEDSLIREMEYRLDTFKGSHFYYPDYGNPCEIIGLLNSKRQHFFIQQAIQDVCDQDPRIGDYSLHLSTEPAKVLINIMIGGSSVNYEVQ